MEVQENCRIDMRLLYRLNSDGQLALIKWCMIMKLITNGYKCPKCGRSMKLIQRHCVKDGYSWVCRTGGQNLHQVKRSVRSFSWFNDRRLSMLNILLISYLWIKKAGHYFTMDELSVSFCTVTDWYNYCRQVCVEICVLESEVLGGEGITIEIHETRFTQGENLRFRGENGKWLVIGTEKGTKKYFFIVCKKKNKEALYDIIKDWVLPGSIIMSDLWTSFECLNVKKFKQLKMIQNLTFKHLPKKGPSARENIFGIVKDLIRGPRPNDIFILHLAEYMWRRFHNDNTRSLVESFFKSLTRIYQPHDCDYME